MNEWVSVSLITMLGSKVVSVVVFCSPWLLFFFLSWRIFNPGCISSILSLILSFCLAGSSWFVGLKYYKRSLSAVVWDCSFHEICNQMHELLLRACIAWTLSLNLVLGKYYSTFKTQWAKTASLQSFTAYSDDPGIIQAWVLLVSWVPEDIVP